MRRLSSARDRVLAEVAMFSLPFRRAHMLGNLRGRFHSLLRGGRWSGSTDTRALCRTRARLGGGGSCARHPLSQSSFILQPLPA